MRNFMKPCIICGTLSRGTRCEQHQKELDQRKQAAKEKNPAHQEKKKALYGNKNYRQERARVVATATICHICNKPFIYGDRIEADHLYPGDPTSPLLPAHRKCNQQKGNTPPKTTQQTTENNTNNTHT